VEGLRSGVKVKGEGPEESIIPKLVFYGDLNHDLVGTARKGRLGAEPLLKQARRPANGFARCPAFFVKFASPRWAAGAHQKGA